MKKYKAIILMVITLLGLAYLEWYGYIWHNSVFASQYSVKGIDISHHQGEIDWNTLKESQQIQFIFMKATEGSDFRDPRFEDNWESAKKNGYLYGVYHFFTLGSSGVEQAENFICTVPIDDASLPPVVDVEVGGIEKEKFNKELNDFLSILEDHYNKRPIIYVMYPLYEGYIKGEYTDNPIWIRDIVMMPRLSDNRKWTFWQYCNRGHLSGIEGFVDLNCYSGTREQLQMLSESIH